MKQGAAWRVGTGFSDQQDPGVAVCQALEQALSRTGPPELTVVLVTEGYDPERVLSSALGILGPRPLVGAWVPGIILDFRVYRRGVGVLTIGGEGVQAVTHLEPQILDEAFAQGERLAQALAGQDSAPGGTILLFPDGCCPNVCELLRGMYDRLGPDYAYLGGGSGDNLRPDPAFQFTESGVARGAVAAALLLGPVFEVALDHGWDPAGEPVIVTRAEGRRVFELDGLPAFERYADLVRDCTRAAFAARGMRHPLGLPAAGGRFILRDPVRVEEDGSLVFVTEVPENSIATVMKADAESLIVAARGAVRRAVEAVVAPRLLLVFDCVSRQSLLGPDAEREMQAMAGVTPPRVPVFGMLTFGEISSLTGTPLFYCKTVVAAAG